MRRLAWPSPARGSASLGEGFEIKKAHQPPLCPLCFMLGVEIPTLWLLDPAPVPTPLLAAMLSHLTDSSPSGTTSLNKPFLLEVDVVKVFSTEAAK